MTTTTTFFQMYQDRAKVVATYEAKLAAAKGKKNKDYAKSLLYSAHYLMLEAKRAYEREYMDFMSSN